MQKGTQVVDGLKTHACLLKPGPAPWAEIRDQSATLHTLGRPGGEDRASVQTQIRTKVAQG